MNFYAVLGIDRDASPAEIKRAYTRLARRYHPGINPGDRAAEAMFERVSKAYETLIDPRRRQQYDSGGARPEPDSVTTSFVFSEFDFSSPMQGPQASTFTELFAEVLHPVPAVPDGRTEDGADIHTSLTVSFGDAVAGAERQVIVTRQVVCGGCSGLGYVMTAEGECRKCGGSGHVRWARGHMVFSKLCGSCHGSGRQSSATCAVCGGQGRSVRAESMPVRVPSGIVDGATLRLEQAGHAGRHGGRTGDLYVTVRVEEHEFFRRHGDDLLCVLPVAIHEAALGAEIEAPSLEGPVTLRIPPGTQAGQRLRVAGRGMPTIGGRRGDLLFEVRIVLPAALDDRSKELLREFGRINATDVREAFAQKSGA